MAYALGLPAALRARGLKVEVVPGWETRSAGSFNPKGAVAHWTAGPRGTTGRPSLNVCVNGRPGLDGPLCNVYGARDGTAVVVSASRANHAGTGGWRGLVGNSSVFGTEMEGADANDFTDAQRWAYPRINAAYCDLGGFGPDMVCGHSEWAGARKTDINGYTMDAMRAEVAAILTGNEDWMSALSDTEQRALYNRVMGFQRQRWYVIKDGKPVGVPEGTAGALPATALDTLDGNWLTEIITGGTQTVMGEVSSAFHQEADRDAANQAALATQLETVGSGDPVVLAAALRSALGESLAADVAARLTVTAG